MPLIVSVVEPANKQVVSDNLTSNFPNSMGMLSTKYFKSQGI